MASYFSMLQNLCLVIGVITFVTRFVLPLLATFYQLCRPAKDLKRYGEWTVITGATDGIGRAMALELAKKGQNLIIVGRSESKLRDVTQELQSKKPSCQVETVQIDLSDFGEEGENDLLAVIENKNVGILVNNAGLSYEFVQYFHEVDQERISDIVEVNACAVTLISHMIVKNCFVPKKRGAIINISSAGSIIPHQLHAVYSASKAYVNKFSDDLRREYPYLDVSVQIPFFVATKMSKMKHGSLTVATSTQYASSAVRQIGYEGLISPFAVHAFMLFVINLMPDVIMNAYVDNLHKVVRKRGMRRKEQKAKLAKEGLSSPK